MYKFFNVAKNAAPAVPILATISAFSFIAAQNISDKPKLDKNPEAKPSVDLYENFYSRR